MEITKGTIVEDQFGKIGVVTEIDGDIAKVQSDDDLPAVMLETKGLTAVDYVPEETEWDA